MSDPRAADVIHREPDVCYLPDSDQVADAPTRRMKYAPVTPEPACARIPMRREQSPRDIAPRRG